MTVYKSNEHNEHVYCAGPKSGSQGSKKSLVSHGKESSMKVKKKTVSRKKEETYRARSPTNNPYDADESDSEELPSGYHQVPIQVINYNDDVHKSFFTPPPPPSTFVFSSAFGRTKLQCC